jgi:hypothetical protein
VLAVMLLCVTAFSLVREVRHVRDLEAAQNDLRAKLQEARDGLRSVKQRLDARPTPQHAAVRSERVLRKPAPKPHPTPPGLASPKPSGGQPWRRETPLNAQRKNGGGSNTEARSHGSPARGDQAYYVDRAHPQLPPYPPATAGPYRYR